MGWRASLSVEPGAETRYLELTLKCPFDDLSQHLRAEAGGVSTEHGLVHGWNVLSVEVPAGASRLALAVDRLLPIEQHAGDGRDLGLQLRPPVLHADAERHARVARAHAGRVEGTRRFLESPLAVTARTLRYESGFHGPEMDEGEPFRWMAREGRLAFPPADRPRYLEVWVRSLFRDGSQSLSFASGGTTTTVRLVEGWSAVSVPVEAGCSEMRLTAGRLWPRSRHASDLRELSLQVRAPILHAEAGRHGHVERQHRNRVRNFEELLAGAVKLESTPPKLGIDITGTCNVKPPCVYCEWDIAKEREGENVELPFNATTLVEYGPFFANSFELVNCSIGEPFMVKSIDALLDVFGAQGKLLELTTNGQILTDVNIRKLLGRNVHLYVSLDAATPETYARLRNDTLPRILDNLERLIAAKGGPGRLPLVYLVFMPMRANVHEVDAFVELCARLRVDRLVLRPLNPSPGVKLKWDRAGYHYDYQQEILPFEELVRISGRVAGLCARAGVALSDQLDFGGETRAQFALAYERGLGDAEAVPLAVAAERPGLPAEPAAAPAEVAPAPMAEVPTAVPAAAPAEESSEKAEAPVKLPICTEPWTSLYVLRRGTLPCCYGGGPIAPMGEFQQAWNSPLMIQIRSELRAGRFHRYCFDSPDCPIVRKSDQAHDLPPSQKLLLLSRRALDRVRRSGYGVPGKLYRLSKHYWRLAAARLAR